jgi:3-oxoacyl-[acyl-carrier-protein] synthase II
LSIFAAEQALLDAGLDTESRLGDEVGIVLGTGIGGIGATEDAVRIYDTRGPSRINPLAITQLMPNSSTGQVAIRFGIEGPSLTITTACAASANSVGEAKNLIERGVVDTVIAGGTESGTTPMTIGAFAQIRALSTNNESPKEACRPFDKNRDGFVMAEGSTILVLENEETAKKRGAKIYGYVDGYGSTTDAFHITAPSEGGDVITFTFEEKDQANKAKEVLENSTLENNNLLITVEEGAKQIPAYIKNLSDNNIEVSSVTASKPTLDDVFLKVTGYRLEGSEESKVSEGAK